ncbi:TIGR00341 family protein [Taibaiella lutea]|nr:TIGR00341 family protein [Taibaiella lutea]
MRQSIFNIIKTRFDLSIDQAHEDSITSSLKKSVDFVGANLWTLIFAIFIASIGLNVNSTAVIIGAMLISPLMGPIMGVGLGLGIYDVDLVKKGLRNLLVATFIGIVTSTLYFIITPLHTAQSELLARTTPSIWDVFIAFFGGLAGMVGASRKEKGNVIPGVAIATALMPPLCTAGFGLATGNLAYFFGAIYLYSINSVFICYGTIIIVRFLKFERRHFTDKIYENKISRYIYIILIITILPSIYLGYRIVDKSIFENNAQKFVNSNFHLKKTQVVNQKNIYGGDTNKIELLLIGAEMPQSTIDSIVAKMPAHGLKHTLLDVKQGLDAKQEIDFAQIKASILEDVFKKDSSNRFNTVHEGLGDNLPDIGGELKALFPAMKSYTATRTIMHSLDSLQHKDSMTMVVIDTKRFLTLTEREKLNAWLKTRLQADSIRLIVEQE